MFLVTMHVTACLKKDCPVPVKVRGNDAAAKYLTNSQGSGFVSLCSRLFALA